MPTRLIRRCAWLLALGFVGATAACVPAALPSDTSAAPEIRLQQMLDRWRQRAGVPAVALAVDRPGRSRFVAASGTREREGGTPVNSDAPFRIASITKLFVATVIMQLVEEGKVRLDAPVSEYVPGYAPAEGVTIRQLLNHTSGIPDYTRTERFHENVLADRDRRWTSDELLALVAKLRRDFAPGTDFLYCNTGYILLGKVIESVTGSTWAREIRTRILDPLRLRHTHIAGAEPVPGGVLPAYIDADQDGDVENVEAGRPWPSLESIEGPAGAIVSTAGDLAAFAAAVFRGRLLSPNSLQQMVAESPHHPRNSNYGLGVEIMRPDYRLTAWGHGGLVSGFISKLWYVPHQNLVVVVLANDVRANPADLAELVVRAESRS